MRGFAVIAALVCMSSHPATAQTALVPADPAAATNAAAPAGSIIGPVLNVSDAARSRAFYVDGLGMIVRMTMGRPERRETMLGFGTDPAAPGLILLSDETPHRPRAITHGTGYERLVLRMTDLAATHDRLRAQGYHPEPIRDVAMGYRMMLVTDPDGYKLELVERRKAQ
jgi:catechol 2,3-dioxygenase-like lactoylglutathione lyase family enzyme